MDKQLMYEQKQKRLQYTETKWKMCNEIVNLSELKKKEKENELEQRYRKINSLQNHWSNYNSHKNRIPNYINIILKMVCSLNQTETQNKISALWRILNDNREINKRVVDINQQMSKYSQSLKINNMMCFINQNSVILKKYNILYHIIDCHFRSDKDYQTFKTDNKTETELEFIKNFSNNYDIFIKDIEQMEERVKQNTENRKNESSKITTLQREKRTLENEMNKCKDKIKAAQIGVKIAEHSVAIEEAKNNIKTNVLNPEDLQLQYCKGSVVDNNQFVNINNELIKINTLITDFNEFEKMILTKIQEIENIKKNYYEELNKLKELLKDIVNIEITDKSIFSNSCQGNMFITSENANKLLVYPIAEVATFEDSEKIKSIMSIFEKIQNSHFSDGIRKEYNSLKESIDFIENSDNINRCDDYKSEQLAREIKVKEKNEIVTKRQTCESNIKKYKEELVLREELLDEINARIEYETTKKDFESFMI